MQKDDLSQNILEKLTARFKGAPNYAREELSTVAEDIAQSIIKRYHLVTDKELQTQKKILEKTQEKLEELEKKLHQLQA